METFPYDPMGQLQNILDPSYNLNSLSSMQGGGMSFNGTGNPLVNQLSVPLSQNYSTTVNSTPSWGSAFDSVTNGDAGLSDLGGMLGSRFKSFGQGIGSNLSNNETFQNMHGNLSAKNQFGNLWGGLQALTGLYSGIKQMRLADKQYDLQNDMWNKSWDANKKSVNESVDLRAANRFNEDPNKRKEHVAKYSI